MEKITPTLRSVRATRQRLWILALAAMLLSTLVIGGRGDAATAYDSEELQFLGLINDYRNENGLRPLLLSDTLTVSSERHSNDMADYSFFAHNTEQSSYYPAASEPWDRMEAEGYRYNTAKGENLAVGYETAEEAMKAWKESPSHNEAMLDGNYRVIGVARINSPGSVHGWYWTTDFGGHVDPSAHAAGEDPQPATPNPVEQSRPAPPENPQPAVPEEEAAGPATDTNDLENGAMGKPGIWTQQARDGAELVHEDGYARLGGYHDGVDELRQKIRISEDSTLAYDLRIRTGGDQPADRMLVRLTDENGKLVGVLEEYTGRDAASWERQRTDLSRFAGQTLFLSFHAQTDGGRLTTFQVDKVALTR
jgi:hypothetical protein